MPALRFRLAGIPIRVEPAFFLVAILIGLTGREGILLFWWVVSVFISVLVHELGHAFAFRAFKQAPSIVLHGFGGLTSSAGTLSRWPGIAVSAAGPIVEIVMLGIPALLLRKPVALHFASFTWYQALGDLAWVSFGWGLVNLAPVLPMDGGNIATSLLASRRHGAQIVQRLSLVVSGGGAIWAFTQQQPLLGLWALMFASHNLRALMDARDEPHRDRLWDGHRAVDGGDPEQAMRIAEEIQRATRSRQILGRAKELETWACLARGDRGAAESALARMPAGQHRSGYIAGYLALEAGETDAALDILVRAFVDEPTWPPNRMLALRAAREGWLETLAGRLLALEDSDGPGGVADLTRDLHNAGCYRESARLSELLFEDGRHDRPSDAYNRACSLARLGETSGAVEWLGRAVEHGFGNLGHLDKDEDMESLRQEPAFQEVRGRILGQTSS